MLQPSDSTVGVAVAGLAACAAVRRGARGSRRVKGPVMVGNATAAPEHLGIDMLDSYGTRAARSCRFQW